MRCFIILTAHLLVLSLQSQWACQSFSPSAPPSGGGLRRFSFKRMIRQPWERVSGKKESFIRFFREVPVRPRLLKRRKRTKDKQQSGLGAVTTVSPSTSPTPSSSSAVGSSSGPSPRLVFLPKPIIFREISKPEPIPVATRDEFMDLVGRFQGGKKALARLSVMGATGDMLHEHPVVQLVHARARTGSKPGEHRDGHKIGLAIEGGGMRGAVSAGAAAAIHMLGLHDAIDVVYGSSAGALVAAFFVSRQLNGTVIYSDVLPAAGKGFLDRGNLVSAMGLGFHSHQSRPVINLDFLLSEVIHRQVPLDWPRFWENNKAQPVKVIASGLCSLRSHALSAQDGHFSCMDSFLDCLRASMCVPGVAGPSVRLKTLSGDEPLADALLFQPIPFRSAVDDGCTHVICLRSRPDGSEVLGKKASGVYEDWIAKRFLKEHNQCPDAAEHMTKLDHIRIYAEDILMLNEASDTHQAVVVPSASDPSEGRSVHLLPIAPPATCAEVDTLETRREELVRGLKEGFARAWDILAPRHVADAMPGAQAAEELFAGPTLMDDFEGRWMRVSQAFADDLLIPSITYDDTTVTSATAAAAVAATAA